MGVGIMLLVVVLLGAGLAVRSKKWKTLMSATGPNAEQLEVKYQHLKSNNIKCKLITEAGPGPGAGMMQPDMMPSGGGMLLRLKVHQKDMEKAKLLLEDLPEAM